MHYIVRQHWKRVVWSRVGFRRSLQRRSGDIPIIVSLCPTATDATRQPIPHLRMSALGSALKEIAIVKETRHEILKFIPFWKKSQQSGAEFGDLVGFCSPMRIVCLSRMRVVSKSQCVGIISDHHWMVIARLGRCSYPLTSWQPF